MRRPFWVTFLLLPLVARSLAAQSPHNISYGQLQESFDAATVVAAGRLSASTCAEDQYQTNSGLGGICHVSIQVQRSYKGNVATNTLIDIRYRAQAGINAISGDLPTGSMAIVFLCSASGQMTPCRGTRPLPYLLKLTDRSTGEGVALLNDDLISNLIGVDLPVSRQSADLIWGLGKKSDTQMLALVGPTIRDAPTRLLLAALLIHSETSTCGWCEGEVRYVLALSDYTGYDVERLADALQSSSKGRYADLIPLLRSSPSPILRSTALVMIGKEGVSADHQVVEAMTKDKAPDVAMKACQMLTPASSSSNKALIVEPEGCASTQFGPTDEITVVAWIDPNAPDISSNALTNAANQADTGLVVALNTGVVNCGLLLLKWLSQATGPLTLVSTPADVTYVNIFLIHNTANVDPGPTINPAEFVQDHGSYRLFNDFKLSSYTTNEQGNVMVSYSPVSVGAEVGYTHDPCNTGVPAIAPGEVHPANGFNGYTNTYTGAFQMTEGRVNSNGVRLSKLLNGREPPYIWNVVRFGADGSEKYYQAQPYPGNYPSEFPTTSVYKNGTRVAVYAQSPLVTFTAFGPDHQLQTYQVP